MSSNSASVLRSQNQSINRFVVFLVLGVGFHGAHQLPAQVIFAGTQIEIVGGASFPLSAPSGIATDGAGNLYIADTGDNQILLVSPDEGGYASPVIILSGLSTPKSVASDWNGNLFVTDSGNNRVLMLPAKSQGLANTITLASGLNNPSGIAVDWSENIYVTDTGNNQLIEIPWINNNYGNANVISTGFNNPTSIAVDSKKTLYISDVGNDRTVKEPLTPTGYTSRQPLTLLTPSPVGVAVDGSLNLWTGSGSTGSVVKSPWNSAGNRYNSSAYIGGGFALPQGLAINTHGVLFVADAGNNRVMELVNASANFGLVNVGAPPALQTYQFEITAGTTIGSTAVYTQGVVGQDFQDAGGSTCQPATYSSNTLCEVNVKFAPLGPGAREGAVILYDSSGDPLATAFISGVGAEPQAAFIPGIASTVGSGLSGPSGVAVDGNGDVFIADTGNDRVVEVPKVGNGYGAQVTIASDGLSSPMGLAVDGANNLYIVSSGNDKLVKLPWLSSGYGPEIKVGLGLYGPTSVAVDALGSVYLADTLNSALWKIPWTGSGYDFEYHFGNYTKFPYGIALDGSGNVFFSSPYQNVVVEVPWLGGVFRPQFNLQLPGTSFPSALAVDGNSDLYVVDSVTNQVFMLPWNGKAYGTEILLAGGFNAPSGIAADASGNIYIADTGNNQIVKINLSVPGPVTFPSTYVGSSSHPSLVLVQNTGNQALNLTAVNYPADFPQSGTASNSCATGSLLGQGASCALTPAFTPLSVNPQISESISLIDNNQNISGFQQSILLLGSGTGELAQSITFLPLSNAVYGSSDIPLSAIASSALNITYHVVSGPGLIIYGQMLRVTGAGSIIVQATQPGNSVYQAAAPVSVTLVVSPAVLTVSANNVSAIYGNIPPTFGWTISGFVRGESFSNISGSASVTSTATWNSGIGNYPVTASLGSLNAANYTFQFTPGLLTVNPAKLTVTAVSVASVFGKPSPSLAWTLNGFKNGDTASVVIGAPILTTAANSGSPAGTYPIFPTIGSLWAANYTFQLSAGSLTVHQASLVFTSNSQSVVYGSAIPSLTYNVQGFAADDSAQTAFTGIPQVISSAAVGSPAGQYPIAISLGTLQAANYHLTFVASTLTVQKAILTLTPMNAQIVYGQSLPDFTYGLTGFVNGDKPLTISGNPLLSACTNQCEAAGAYSIYAAAGSLKAANYTFKMGTGTLTIVKAPLTIIANSTSAVYGAGVPIFSSTFEGLVNGDSPKRLSGVPSLTWTGNSRSGAGSYPIIVTMGTLEAPNYAINFKSGSFTISQASLTVTPEASAMTYGSALPTIAFQITGFQNGDTVTVATTGKPNIVTSASAHAKVGTYPVGLVAGTLVAHSYNLQFEPGSITVAPAPLVVTAKSLSMKVGSAVPTLTFTTTGLQNGDSIASATTGLPSLTTSANAKSAAGSYPISISAGTMKAGNYLPTFVDGVLQVTQ